MTQIEKLLRASGAVLVRTRKHRVYRLPNGRNYVIAATASDRRAQANQVAELRRQLGVRGDL